jgi:ubiquinone/menaquinone biosynthesis C-methylase UbiE
MLAVVMERAKSFKAWVYDMCIVPMTSRWYREVLLECPVNSSMLDVGIGTASSLIANRDIIVSKQMTVMGVDYDLAYVRSAQANVAACGGSLQDVVTVEQVDIHDYNKSLKERFDVIYFSGSFMIIPRQVEALRHCVQMLRSPVPKVPDGCNIFFTQTFERRTLVGRYITPWVKRALRAITTIDFGEVTYEDDFRAALDKAEVDIVRVKSISSSYYRTQKLVMARPRVSLKRE